MRTTYPPINCAAEAPPDAQPMPAGAAASPPRRLALAAGLVASLAGAVIALSACGGGGGSTGRPDVRPLAALEPVVEGSLVPKVREVLRSRHAARKANPTVSFDRLAATASTGLTALAGAPAQATTGTAPVFSGTPVQEAGVDEADLLKTNPRPSLRVLACLCVRSPECTGTTHVRVCE
jgi:hypothetical protein